MKASGAAEHHDAPPAALSGKAAQATTAPKQGAAKTTAKKAALKPQPPTKPPGEQPNLEKSVPDRPTMETVAADKAVATKVIAAKPQAKPVPAVPPRPNRPGFAAPAQTAAPTPPPEPERRPNINDRNPPRVPSKAENFVEGDHVVYPTHGVGKVERIAVEEIAGHSLELIHITFEENRMTLRVPVSKARSAGLRKLASRKMFDEALAVLKGRARIKRTMWSRRAQEYEAKINSGDPLAIAEVVRDLHRNAGQPDQSFSERQIYEAAMDRLAAELGALDKTDKATAVIKLANFLKTIV
jgi:CarD family transcriptional regulator